MDCVKHTNDVLLNLFSNLSFDIQEKIYNEVLIIKKHNKEIKNNKMNYDCVMVQLQEAINQMNKNFKPHYQSDMYNYSYSTYELGNLGDYLNFNRVFQEFNIGKKERNIIDITDSYEVNDIGYVRIYDEDHYKALDYLYNCNVEWKLINNSELQYSYKIKDHMKYITTNMNRKCNYFDTMDIDDQVEFEENDLPNKFCFLNEYQYIVDIIDEIQFTIEDIFDKLKMHNEKYIPTKIMINEEKFMKFILTNTNIPEIEYNDDIIETFFRLSCTSHFFNNIKPNMNRQLNIQDYINYEIPYDDNDDY